MAQKGMTVSIVVDMVDGEKTIRRDTVTARYNYGTVGGAWIAEMLADRLQAGLIDFANVPMGAGFTAQEFGISRSKSDG